MFIYCVIICREQLPGKWQNYLDDFQKMIVMRCLRPDKLTDAMQDYVATHLGQRFIEPQVGKKNVFSNFFCFAHI